MSEIIEQENHPIEEPIETIPASQVETIPEGIVDGPVGDIEIFPADTDVEELPAHDEEKPQQNPFAALGVEPRLVKAIEELGFATPMPVQAKVIPHLLSKEGDVVALAQTGTGKTAAFGLPVIQRIDTSRDVPQALILSPTRELCLQIGSDLADFSKYIPDLKVLPVYGGSSIESQIRALKKGVQIIVATPGRLIDLIKRGVVKLNDVHTVILDEADEMLNMGFVDDIDQILSHVPDDRKMLMFSATMPNEIAKIAKKYMKDPVEFVVGTRNEGAANVKHVYYMVNAKDKYLALKRIADDNPNIYAIIFCRTRRDTQEIADKLIQDGYNADALHGDLSQQQRDITMKKFRDGVIKMLVATDVAARGLDVDDLTHVINYGLPDDPAVYTHRSGRTGRAGKTGTSVAIIHSREKGKLKEIEKKIGKTFERKEVPTPQHIIEKQIYNLADRIERVKVDDAEIDKYVDGVSRKLGWLSQEDLLKRVLSLEFNRLLDYYKDAPKIDVIEEKPRKEKPKKGERAPRSAEEKDRRTASKGMERLYLNAGKRDGFYAGTLIDTLNRNVPGERVDVGRIDLMPGYSLFDVKRGDAKRVVNALKGAEFMGKHLFCEIASPDKDYSRASARKAREAVSQEEPFAQFRKGGKGGSRKGRKH
ncbi:MAG: DEAD/DEAH box helicase [Bacteroidales bacterium]|nr:DEAD/DEAH box helicase [Bacteroidales bacterium]